MIIKVIHDINEEDNDLDQDTALSLLVNAIFFDDQLLIPIVKSYYPSVEDFPDKNLIIQSMMDDKEISDKEATSKYNDFIVKYYNEEVK